MNDDTERPFRRDVLHKYRARDASFRLADVDPADTFGLDLGKQEAKAHLAAATQRLRDMQERLYAGERNAVLLVFQAMDTAGKDSVIEHVMSGINPQGCAVTAFKAPSAAELRHDFLWRSTVALPERGRIGIFNRSYYEEVLVVRVHPEMLGAQGLSPAAADEAFWAARYESIRDFERHLARNGTLILKFHLVISKAEQKKRLLARIREPDKNWKFSLGDLAERALWDEYQHAYEEAIRHTATPDCPWYVLPANDKWFARLAVASILVEQMERLDLAIPTLSAKDRADLEEGRHLLESEAQGSSA